MTMMAEKVMLLGSTVGLAGVAQIDPVSVGRIIGSSTASVILGIVAVSAVVGLVRIYRDRENDAIETRKAHDEHTKRLYALIEKDIGTNQRIEDAVQANTVATAEVIKALEHCKTIQEERRSHARSAQ